MKLWLKLYSSIWGVMTRTCIDQSEKNKLLSLDDTELWETATSIQRKEWHLFKVAEKVEEQI
jgi:hypothetical protein